MNVQQTLERRLGEGLAPIHLEVVNESGQHNVPRGSETHFKVVVVTDAFSGKPQVARHRMVYRLLGEELQGGVHALAVHAYSPEDWAAVTGAPDSPQCRGGQAAERAGR